VNDQADLTPREIREVFHLIGVGPTAGIVLAHGLNPRAIHSQSSARQRKWIKRLQQAVLGNYLRGRAFRRFAGTPLRLLDMPFLVLAASNNCRMPCSNSSTALSNAPSCPTRTIATNMCKSKDGGRNTSTVSREVFLAIKRAGSSPTPYPD
jgi:hypothetical protein